ncbi:lysophospholipase [Paenibacillus sp. FSL R7-0273]|uniref:GDSL-type esterase/lipase family protein n=1 Tax=Paenibacillus sp. FSL R7-0273 TaxID=1536772 RepID=UPI0004F88E6F|nr:GDSL-type esterase/lipase family protein [Paenibacillus sp. FSL R7-0273]AIQ48083.1 lysophospholipase [Paenibacillus sp. FSL R7-0273]OMF85196.1 lysophospholipase [Paenibacillus sp. FSL R7-0273]
MKDAKWTWRSVSVISIAATLLLIVGFVYAVGDIINPQGEALTSSLPQVTEAPEAAAEGELRILALGDSLAKGTGDNSGSGFVRRALDGLSGAGGTAGLIGNMGINGLTTSGLQTKLQEEGVQYALRQANVVLISIGGNDLFRGSDILGNGTGVQAEEGAGSVEAPADNAAADGASVQSTGILDGKPGALVTSTPKPGEDELTPEALLSALPEAAKRLSEILETVAEINPQAQVYYVGLYNPFGDIEDLLVPGNQAVTAWNNAAMDIINTHSNMTLVPTFDLFNRHLDKYLSSDHFHPNGDGYQRISERIVQAIR